ncbi:MAG: hypothetical protein ACOYJ2_02985 [Rickettsiales bacterium]
MANTPQNPPRPAQNAPTANQPNTGNKVGDNTRKDDATAQKQQGMKTDANAGKPAKKAS